MNTTIKAIFISLGSLFTALFLTFAIGMCTTGFRQMMFRVWNVVPEQQYTEKANNESVLKEELDNCTKELYELTNERQKLLDKITNLDSTNVEQAKQIADYTSQVDDLDAQIQVLNKKMDTISTNLSNASVSYQGILTLIHLPTFDSNGNFQYTTAYQVNGYENYCYATELTNQINEQFKYIESNFNQAKDPKYIDMLVVTQRNQYLVQIDNTATMIDTECISSNQFSADSTLTIDINFNGESSDFDTILANITSSKRYMINVTFEYEIDANNEVINPIVYFKIAQA